MKPKSKKNVTNVSDRKEMKPKYEDLLKNLEKLGNCLERMRKHSRNQGFDDNLAVWLETESEDTSTTTSSSSSWTSDFSESDTENVHEYGDGKFLSSPKKEPRFADLVKNKMKKQSGAKGVQNSAKNPKELRDSETKRENMPFSEVEIHKLKEFYKRSTEIDEKVSAITRDMRTKLDEFQELLSERIRCYSQLTSDFVSFLPIIKNPTQFKASVLTDYSLSVRYGILGAIRNTILYSGPYISVREYNRHIDSMYAQMKRDERTFCGGRFARELRYTLEELEDMKEFEEYSNSNKMADNRKASEPHRQVMSNFPPDDRKPSGLLNKSNSWTKDQVLMNERMGLKPATERNSYDKLSQYPRSSWFGECYYNDKMSNGWLAHNNQLDMEMNKTYSNGKRVGTIYPEAKTSLAKRCNCADSKINENLYNPETKDDQRFGFDIRIPDDMMDSKFRSIPPLPHYSDIFNQFNPLNLFNGSGNRRPGYMNANLL